MKKIELWYSEVSLFYTTRDRYIKALQVKPHLLKVGHVDQYEARNCTIVRSAMTQIQTVRLRNKDKWIDLPIDSEHSNFIPNRMHQNVPRFLIKGKTDITEMAILEKLDLTEKKRMNYHSIALNTTMTKKLGGI